MTTLARIVFPAFMAVASVTLPTPAFAQDETALKTALEGHRVTVRIPPD